MPTEMLFANSAVRSVTASAPVRLHRQANIGFGGETSDASARGMRVALFSGNYNCVRDGANKALNRLVGHLLARGAAVRVYSPAIAEPAFPATGDLVPVRSFAIPGRSEYRVALGLPRSTRDDIMAFQPNIVHLSAPDPLGWQAKRFAHKLGIPVVASLHTRFETYLSYYGLDMFRPAAERYLTGFYNDCDFALAPNQYLADELAAGGLGSRARIWGRGVDRTLFSPTRRDVAWRREQGFGDDEIVLLFFGRLVVEKGTEIFAAVVDALRARGHKVRALLVGEGPMREKLTASLGDAVFTGHLEDAALARAVASADILINPSATEAFGNVNLEAMAAGLAIVSADVPSASALIENGRSGMLVPADDIEAYTDAVAQLMQNDERRLRLGADACTASARFDWPTALDAVIETYALTGAAGYDAAAIEHGAQMTKGVSRAA